jgi:hypothetical protein
VLENRVLRRIFGPKRDELTGEWRKLHNEELNDCSDDQIEKNEMGGEYSTCGERSGAYRVLVGRSERKWSTGIFGVDCKIILKLFFNK